MASFSCLGLHSIFSCELSNGYKHELKSEVCFGISLRTMDYGPTVYSTKYHICLLRDPEYSQKYQALNWTPFDAHDIYCYLRCINKVKPFKFKISDFEFKGYSAYKVDIEITGKKPEIIFVLQSIKRLYEWPYCFFLLEAKKMQKMSEFKFESILNLFNYVAAYYWPERCNTGHSYSCNSKPLPYRQLKERLSKCKVTTDLFPYAKICYNTHIIPSNTIDWTDEKFRDRLSRYVETRKRLSE